MATHERRRIPIACLITDEHDESPQGTILIPWNIPQGNYPYSGPGSLSVELKWYPTLGVMGAWFPKDTPAHRAVTAWLSQHGTVPRLDGEVYLREKTIGCLYYHGPGGEHSETGVNLTALEENHLLKEYWEHDFQGGTDRGDGPTELTVFHATSGQEVFRVADWLRKVAGDPDPKGDFRMG